jgi:hypothetical protein
MNGNDKIRKKIQKCREFISSREGIEEDKQEDDKSNYEILEPVNKIKKRKILKKINKKDLECDDIISDEDPEETVD